MLDALKRRHMLPYGKRDRPIYATASLTRAKEKCDLIPFDFPGTGLWTSLFLRQLAQAAGLLTCAFERNSAGL